MPEFAKAVSTPTGFAELCEHIERMRSPRKVVWALGMKHHQSCSLAKTAWDQIYRHIIYRADMYTLYQQPLPSLAAGPPDDPAGALLLPELADGEPGEGQAGDAEGQAGDADANGVVARQDVPNPDFGLDFVERLKHTEAVKYIVNRIGEAHNTGRRIFSVPVGSNYISSLQSKLSLAEPLVAQPSLRLRWWDEFIAAASGLLALRDGAEPAQPALSG